MGPDQVFWPLSLANSAKVMSLEIRVSGSLKTALPEMLSDAPDRIVTGAPAGEGNCSLPWATTSELKLLELLASLRVPIPTLVSLKGPVIGPARMRPVRLGVLPTAPRLTSAVKVTGPPQLL